MTENQAREIVQWMTEDPKTLADYGKSYKQSEVEEAFAMCGRELPAWVSAVKALRAEHDEFTAAAKAIGEQVKKSHDGLVLDALGLH